MLTWNEYVRPYEEVLKEVKLRLEKANKSLYSQLGYAPIESIKTRIKAEQSARKKLEKKGLPWNEKSLTIIQDVAGMRIVCRFLDDITEVVSLIKSWETPVVNFKKDSIGYEQVLVVEELNYIDNPKPSGYRSYHVVCRKGKVFFEIQIRTIAQDFWAQAEHMLKYKYAGQIPENALNRLRSIADIASTLDLAMNDIRQDVNVGTAKSRALDRINKAIQLLEENGLGFKAEHYRAVMEKEQDLDKLRSLSIQAREDVPNQYWKD